MTETHLQNIRSALLKLPPTGPHGFEGFIGAVLTEACGQPFRLASSGSQRGRDGDSAFDAGATYFEAKLYTGAVPKKDTAVKFMDLMADNQGQVDTFIIASTSSIPALNATDFRRTFEATGIGLIVLDYEAAQGAYDRNRWARHWYERLKSSTTALEFWRYSGLLSKIVDGRFDLWGSSGLTDGLFNVFFPTIEGEVKQRIKKWDGKRKENLFGKKIPHSVFLIRDFSED